MFILLLIGAAPFIAQNSGEWSSYGRDPGGERFSPLTDINKDNVKNLERAWTYRTGDVAAQGKTRSSSAFQMTPIMVDGTLFLTTPFNRVMALDPATGTEKWRFDPKINLGVGYHNQLNSRGLATWLDKKRKKGNACRRRIFIGTNDARLIALDAATGKPCANFGVNGEVDLGKGMGINKDDPGEYGMTSPPAVVRGLVITGAAIGDNNRVTAPSGAVRAWDARTGALKWAFDPVPPGYGKKGKANPKGAAGYYLGTPNVWSMVSVDEKRNLVFLPTGNSSPDYYGGERNGIDHYSSSVVALRATTGKVVWHFRTVHHDVWDYDVPAQPALMTIKKDGKKIPIVAAATKMGHLFLLHRETGRPVYPVEERAVPQNGVRGETLSKTQPFPTGPGPLTPQSLKPEDAFGLDEADKKSCAEQIASHRMDGMFTPPSENGTIAYPGDLGGLNWSGVSYDAKNNLIIANTNRFARLIQLVPRGDKSVEAFSARARQIPASELARQTGTPYLMYREFLMRFSKGLVPCNPPPWGTLLAVDAGTGKKAWEVPLGVMPELARFPDAPKWGSLNIGGSFVTATGLVFIGASRDNMFRAFDSKTGEELWKAELPAGGQAAPMTYKYKGKQYVVIAAGGHGRLLTKTGDFLVAFSLDSKMVK
ncbi:MAG: pyrroloquinoline quinone-dependent dehydrogenase [Pyrinomonadaceae bacterium]|nr:pyrroloquinoline quinone-dependent dehydrogenase [Pyrinomonadaceae bacterium]